MRIVAVVAAFLALLAQPVLAQEVSKAQAVLTKAAPSPTTTTAPAPTAADSDPARVAEARRLTAEALAADAAIKARNEAGQAQYNAASADYQTRLAAQRAAQAKYEADLAAQQAAVAQYAADKAAWEARVAACNAGHYDQCGER